MTIPDFRKSQAERGWGPQLGSGYWATARKLKKGTESMTVDTSDIPALLGKFGDLGASGDRARQQGDRLNRMSASVYSRGRSAPAGHFWAIWGDLYRPASSPSTSAPSSG